MIERIEIWFENREKRKKQRLCPHQYEITSGQEYIEESETRIRNHGTCDFYCPSCDKRQLGLSVYHGRRLIEEQKVRDRFYKREGVN